MVLIIGCKSHGCSAKKEENIGCCRSNLGGEQIHGFEH
jgi:hypothetical protein